MIGYILGVRKSHSWLPTKALAELSPALQHGIKLILHERNVTKYENIEQYEIKNNQYVRSYGKNYIEGNVEDGHRDEYDHSGKYSDTTYTDFSTSNYGNEIENENMNENENENGNENESVDINLAWAVFFDESAQANYWFNHATGEASWINPNS